MKIMKRFFWLAVLFCGLLNTAAAQVQYYWDSSNRVYLWLNPSDSSALMSEFDSAAGRWKVNIPKDKEKEWKEIFLREIKNRGTDVDPEAHDTEILGSFAIKKMVDEYGNKTWAERRFFKSQIYIRKPDNKTAQVDFLYHDNSTDKTGKNLPAKFTFSSAIWVKENNAAIALEEIFNVAPSSNELLKIFNLDGGTPLPSNGAQAASFWNAWITKIVADDNAGPRFAVYQDKNGVTQYVLVKRLKSSEAVPAVMDSLPSKPPISNLNLEAKKVPPAGGFFDLNFTFTWIDILVAAGMVLIFLGLPLGILFRKQIQKIFWKSSAKPKTEERVIMLEDMEGVRDLFLKKYDVPGNPAYEAFIEAEKKIFREYRSLIDSANLGNKAEEMKQSIINEFLSGLKVDLSESSKVQKWIERGQAFEKRGQEISDLELTSIREFVKKDPLIKFATVSDKDDNWPHFIKLMDDELLKLKEANRKLAEDLQREQLDHSNKLKAEKEKLRVDYEEAVKEDKKELGSSKKKLLETSEELKDARQKISELETDVKNKDSRITKLLEDGTGNAEELNLLREEKGLKAEQIKAVIKLSIYFRQWVSNRYKQAGEETTGALIVSLINHSLYQMCFAIIENQPILKMGMADNLLKCAQPFNTHHTFEDIQKVLKKIQLDAQKEVDINSKQVKFGDTSNDAQFIRAIVGKLKTESNYSLTPFYINLENDGQTLNRINVS